MGDLHLNEIIEVVREKLSNPPDISPGRYSAIVLEAVAAYSRERPLNKVADVTGDGTFDYSLPTDFVDGFSSIISIEYPYDATDQTPSYLQEGSEFTLYRSPSGLVLRFLSSTPSASETYRITYTVEHTVAAASTTLPKVDERAVTNLAAGMMAETLAAEFEKKSRSTLPDVTFDLRSKARDYQEQADRYYRLWAREMGIPEDGRPRAVSLDGDTNWYLSGHLEPLTHPLNVQ